jgi:uncharacterized membrane protein
MEECMADMAEVHESIEVAAPVSEVYSAWTNFTEFPRFMENVVEVQQLSEGRYHWKVKGPLGAAAEYNAYVTEDIPDQIIAWRTDDDEKVRVNGAVRFHPVGEGTRIEVNMGYEAPLDAVGEAVARVFSNPSAQTREDLEHFKRYIENGQQASQVN